MAKTRNRSRSRNVDHQESASQAEACSLENRDAGGETISAESSCHRDVNVGETERILSVMSGGVLTIFGATRGGLMGLGLAVLGGSLLYRGVTGHCEAYHVLGLDTSDPEPYDQGTRSAAQTAQA